MVLPQKGNNQEATRSFNYEREANKRRGVALATTGKQICLKNTIEL